MGPFSNDLGCGDHGREICRVEDLVCVSGVHANAILSVIATLLLFEAEPRVRFK